MSKEVVDYFVSHSDDHVDSDSWDGFYIPDDESYDDFLLAGANLYGGY